MFTKMKEVLLHFQWPDLRELATRLATRTEPEMLSYWRAQAENLQHSRMLIYDTVLLLASKFSFANNRINSAVRNSVYN